MNIGIRELEREIAELTGVYAAIEHDGRSIVLSGMATTEGEHQAALDVARAHLGNGELLVDNIEVTSILPEILAGQELSTADAGDFPSATAGTEDDEAIEPGDFTDQDLQDNALYAAGPTGSATDEEVSEGDEVWVPPTDPPSDGRDEVIGGWQATSMDDNEERPRSATGGIPDEALRDAVLRELREDASTTALEVDVQVVEGVVVLRGVVDDMLDVENAEAVAARVDGVLEVEEQLRVRSV